MQTTGKLVLLLSCALAQAEETLPVPTRSGAPAVYFPDTDLMRGPW